jgi:hypothetical protein
MEKLKKARNKELKSYKQAEVDIKKIKDKKVGYGK